MTTSETAVFALSIVLKIQIWFYRHIDTWAFGYLMSKTGSPNFFLIEKLFDLRNLLIWDVDAAYSGVCGS